MVQNDRRCGEGAGQVDGVRKLRLQKPGVERQAQAFEVFEPRAEGLGTIETGVDPVQRTQDVLVRIKRRGIANSAETTAARADVGFKDRRDRITQQQIGATDNARAGAEIPIDATCAHCGDAVHKLGLADDTPLDRAVRLVEGSALDEDGGDDIVTAGRIGDQLIQQIASRIGDRGDKGMFGRLRGGVVPTVPQVMVRIYDRQIGFQNGFGHGGGLPVAPHLRARWADPRLS